MNDNTSFVVAVLRELAASAAVILAAWGALGGATNALTTKMRLRDAIRRQVRLRLRRAPPPPPRDGTRKGTPSITPSGEDHRREGWRADFLWPPQSEDLRGGIIDLLRPRLAAPGSPR
jgi:hypothetical protein